MRGYDHWKTTNPADEFLGPAPEDDAPLRCIDCGADLPAGDLTLCRACEEKHLTAGAAT